MKPGTAHPVAFSVTCPHCGAQYVCPASGSYMIGLDSIDELARRGTPGVATCQDCGEAFKMPRLVMRLAL